MRTLVVSDLHLGIRTGADVLRRPDALAVLAERCRGVERLVLLGDVLELRHGPARHALAAAEPVLRALGSAIGDGAQVVLVPGNHDHALAAGWLDWRARNEPADPLGLEERVAARSASWIAKRMAGWLAPADVTVAYPGVWLREDVYATHGHYLDVHGTIPSFERLAAGAMGRVVGRVPDPATPDHYEAQLAPVYAWIHAAAQRANPGAPAMGTGSAVRLWQALATNGRNRRLRARALGALFPLVVAAINRAGLGPVRGDLSGAAIRRTALAAMGEVTRRLGLDVPHVIFGHTHRTGMLAGDHPAQWRAPGGGRLHNAGSWVFETHFMGPGAPGTSPYWPGGAIALDASGPPRLERLLAHLPADVLRGGAGAATASPGTAAS